MSTGQKLYDIIVAVNVELQDLLSHLLSIYAEEHALINPPVAGTNALHNLLSTHIVPLEKAIKPYVCKKLFTSKKCDVILPLVDAKKLDNSLLFDVLLKVKDILSIDHTIGNCKNCIGTCCTCCNHISPGCKMCKGNDCTSTEKRLHPCQSVSCTKILQECKEHEMICCTLCKTCIACNKTRFENHVKAVLSNFSTPPLKCPWFTFVHSLEIAECFHFWFHHVTVEECEEFMTNGVALMEEFKNITKLEELEGYLQFLFEQVVDHSKTKLQNVIKSASTVPSSSPAKLKELNNTMVRLNKTMDNLKCIFEHSESCNKYLIANRCSIIDVIMDDRQNNERLEIMATLMENFKDEQRQHDRYNKVQLVRRLNKEFVLKLPLANDEDVKVEYKRDGDGEDCWVEAYVDQKRDGGTVYLRVEGLPHAGDFNVRLILTFEGMSKQEITLSVKVIGSVHWTTKTGALTIVAPPNRGDEDIFSFCADYLDQDKCVHKTTTLIIKVVNDGNYSDGEYEEETDGSDEEADVSDDESLEQESLHAGEFLEKGLRYLERNFQIEGVITFPPLNMIMDHLMREISETFADLLKQESEPGLRLILSNYDDAKFSQFILDSEVRMLFDGAVPATNRLLLFYSRFATIVNARIVKDKVNIHQEMANCINDIKLFGCTFKSTINNATILTGLLVCPHLSRAEVEEEMGFYFNKGDQSKRLMKYFFLTKDEFDEKKSKLTRWWMNVFRKRLLKILNSIKSSMDFNISLEMFKRISGQCMATIACCDAENKSMLPTTSADPQKQILTLLLSNAQLDAIYAPEKKKLVVGAFGCGTSIIGEMIVKNIYYEALCHNRKCLILYVLQDDHSLLEVKNRRFVDRLKAKMKLIDTGDNGSCSDELVSIESGTFHSLAGQSAVGRNSLLNFVKSVILERNTFDSINLVVDEVDHNSIEGEDGIEEFKKLLKLVDYFVIFPRSAYLQVQSPGKEKFQRESNLHRLGLKLFALRVVMRNSVEIVNLAESSQKAVEKWKSILQYPSTPFNFMDEPNLLEGLHWSTLQEEIPRILPLDNADISSTEDKKGMVNVNLLNAANYIDKQNSSSSKTLKIGSTFIKCIPGHRVTNRKPNLINLPESFDLISDKGAKILSIVFDKVCLKDFDPLLKSQRGRYQSNCFDSPTIICNEMEEVIMTYYALTLIPRLQDCCIVCAPDLQRKYFSWKDKEPIYDSVKLRNKILIADISSMRGMESRHVITFINPVAKFDRRVLPEVITRANVILDIISFPVDEAAKIVEAATLEDVVNSWLGKNLETGQMLVNVTDVKASPVSTNQHEICSKEKDCLIINVQSRNFKEYGHGHPTFKDFVEFKREELDTEELKRIDIERAVSNYATKLSLTEEVLRLQFTHK